MARRDNFKARGVAVRDAVQALEAWRRKYVTKGLYHNNQWGIWPYENSQLRDATQLVRTLLENLKGEDPRTKE